MKFSIITINYNNKDGLRKTIESVVNQTYKDFEYIIIDGGSTDGSVEVIKEYANKIDYWVSEPDNGIYNAMNKGILQAHGEYLNFMNSGDSFYNNQVLQSISIYSGDIITGKHVVEINGKTEVRAFPYQNISMLDFFQTTVDFEVSMILDGKIKRINHLLYVSHQASFIRKEIQSKYMYDENYKIVSDWKFFLEALVGGGCSFNNIDVIVASYDMGGISLKELSLNQQEKSCIMQNILLDRLYVDYSYFASHRSPVLDLIPEFNNTCGFHSLVYKTVLMLIKARKLLLKMRSLFK